MRTRALTGRYAAHYTPGDGTGFQTIRESDALEFAAEDTETDRGAQGAPYHCAERHAPVRDRKE